MTVDIPLSRIVQITNPECYKLHLACRSEEGQPLDLFVEQHESWVNWNRWRGTRDDFSREFIFSLIDFYPQRDTWLFGGAFRVLSRNGKVNSLGYEIETVADLSPFVGRLKISLKRPARGRAFFLENHYSDLIVTEILAETHSGESFPGYDKIDLSFPALENLVKRQRPDWKSALENTKGVYLITDTSNSKRYIGSAYNDSGIWSRWQCYADTGHGFNDELTKLIAELGIEYARENFRISLLEYCSMKTDDRDVISRESYWKNVLLTRGKYGYNKN
ncbi:GIY-YIG nuclease family protein [Mariniblastus sp.]|nr:GIY-YIG nuclease family protein [Mariniblastus sp.]